MLSTKHRKTLMGVWRWTSFKNLKSYAKLAYAAVLMRCTEGFALAVMDVIASTFKDADVQVFSCLMESVVCCRKRPLCSKKLSDGMIPLLPQALCVVTYAAKVDRKCQRTTGISLSL